MRSFFIVSSKISECEKSFLKIVLFFFCFCFFAKLELHQNLRLPFESRHFRLSRRYLLNDNFSIRNDSMSCLSSQYIISCLFRKWKILPSSKNRPKLPKPFLMTFVYINIYIFQLLSVFSPRTIRLPAGKPKILTWRSAILLKEI